MKPLSSKEDSLNPLPGSLVTPGIFARLRPPPPPSCWLKNLSPTMLLKLPPHKCWKHCFSPEPLATIWQIFIYCLSSPLECKLHQGGDVSVLLFYLNKAHHLLPVEVQQMLSDTWVNESEYFHPCCCCSVTKSCLTLWSHGLQHSRPPCTSLSPRVCPSSCPLSRWCCPAISSSVALFSISICISILKSHVLHS